MQLSNLLALGGMQSLPKWDGDKLGGVVQYLQLFRFEPSTVPA